MCIRDRPRDLLSLLSVPLLHDVQVDGLVELKQRGVLFGEQALHLILVQAFQAFLYLSLIHIYTLH